MDYKTMSATDALAIITDGGSSSELMELLRSAGNIEAYEVINTYTDLNGYS